MMKMRLTLFLLFLSIASFGQWQYGLHSAVSFGGDGVLADDTYTVGIDSDGFLTVAGFFSGSGDFDPDPVDQHILTSAGGRDIFIAKYRPDGDFMWARSIGGPLDEQVNAMVLDFGDPIIVGTFLGSVDFNPDPGPTEELILNAPGGHGFIAKMRGADGGVQWAKNFGGAAGTGVEPRSIAMDSGPNFYVAGTYVGSNVDFDPGPGQDLWSSLNNDYDIFVASFDSDGDFNWNESMGGNGVDQGYSLLQSLGNLYVTGFYSGTSSFVTQSLSGSGAFVLRMDLTGEVEWARQLGGPSTVGRSITVDEGNVLTIGGEFTGSQDFDPDGSTNFTLNAQGLRDGFICKLEDDGLFYAASRLGGPGDDYVLDVSADGDGNVYSVGAFSANADFDPNEDPNEEYFLTTGVGFISMLDNDLAFLGAQPVGDNGGIAREIWGDESRIFIAGSFSSTVDFDVTAESYPLTSQGPQEGFLVLLDRFIADITITQQPVDVTICEGPTPATFTVAATTTGTTLTYRWFAVDIDTGPQPINNGSTYSGVNTPTLTVNVSNQVAEGYYYCLLTTDGGIEEGSFMVELSINPPAPFADDVINCGPGTVTLVAESALPGEFRWYTQPTGGTPIPGETDGTYTTPFLTVSTPYYVSQFNGSCEGDRAEVFAHISTCQPAPGLDWVKQIGGQGAESAEAIARDANGNTFVVGTYGNVTTDFDPGPGVQTLPYTGGFDMYILKLDPNGDFVWVKRIAGSGNEVPYSLKIDALGNLYIMFEFRQTPDVDPGPGTVLLAATGTLTNADIGIVKLDNDGLYQWHEKVGSAVNEYPRKIELDAAGNPYLIGMYQADITINTTSGPMLMDNLGGTDVFVIRMNPAGQFIWAKSFGGLVTGGLNSTQDQGNDVDITGSNVFVTGMIQIATGIATVDFDPGTGTANRVLPHNTSFILKLTTDGDYVDVFLFTGAIDPDNSTNGLQVEVDVSGNIYAAGNMIGTIDLDPSSGVFEGTHTPGLSSGSYMVKLAADGSLIWANVWNPFGNSFGFGEMLLSASGDIYSLVAVGGIVDVDPSPLVYQVSSNSLFIISVSVLKLNNNGQFNWITQASRPFNITSGTTPSSLILESNGDVYVSGRFSGTVDFDPHECQTNVAAVFNLDGFFYKLSATAANVCITDGPYDVNACGAVNVTYTVAAEGAPNITYRWEYFNPGTSLYEPISDGGRFSDATTSTLTVVVAGGQPGEAYRAIVSAPGADEQTSGSAILGITGAPPSPPGAVGDTRCSPGSFFLTASGAAPGEYRWYTAASGESLIPGEFNDNYTTPFLSATTTYYVSIYNGLCESTKTAVTATITTGITPPGVTGASTCATSASLTLTATGATDGNYLWYTTSGGGTPISGEVNGTYVTPVLTATTNYYVSIVDGSCESTRVMVTAVINAGGSPPTTTNGSHCGPGQVTLTATGGVDGDYRWYEQATGGSPIAGAVNNTFTTPIISTETTYYVSIAPTGCESNRTPVDAVILLTPSTPLTSNAVICGFGAISVVATGGTNGNYRWYMQATGGTALVGEYNSSYITPNLSATTTYYVSVTDGTCESPRAAAAVQVIPFPGAPTVTNASGCPAVGVTLGAGGANAGEYRWYTVPSGGTGVAGAVNDSFSTGPLATTTTYYVSINTGVCEGPRTAVVATIINCDNNQSPAIGNATASTGIGGQTSIAITPLLSDPDNNLDLSTLRIIQQPSSGALASIDASGTLTVDYEGISFSGNDELTIEVCDLAGVCVQRVLVITVAGDVKSYNAVSPNGDGKNDTFYLEFIEVLQETRENKVTIFNRWGDVVFEVENYDNVQNVFSGKNNDGNELPSGTYFYKVEFGSNVPTMTGYLSLKK